MWYPEEMHYAVFDRRGTHISSGPASEVREEYGDGDYTAVPLWRLTQLERMGVGGDRNFIRDYLATHSRPARDVTS